MYKLDPLEVCQRRAEQQAGWLAELLEGRRLGVWLASYCAARFDLAALAEKADWAHHEYASGEPDGWPKEC